MALRPCHLTVTCKINKLKKPGGPLGNFHALFGRSATFYGHFRADTVTSEWSTQISASGGTLVLILTKLFLFLVSYEISVTMKQNYI